MAELPRGFVTFLLTDIEGSTRLWEEAAAEMALACRIHDEIVEAAAERHAGSVVRPRGEGDSRFVVFRDAAAAFAAACDIQRALQQQKWPTPRPMRVRMGLHSAEAELRDDDYYGSGVNRCARLRGIAYGGQILVSQATRDLIGEDAPLRDLGSHTLKDFQQLERVFQAVGEGLMDEFPPLRSVGGQRGNLESPVTHFVGRQRERDELRHLVDRARLVTLTGSGGCGKTRMALQTGLDLAHVYEHGAWLVDLAPLAEPALVPQTVAAIFNIVEEAGRPMLDSVVEYLQSRELLLILDNCEHLVDASARLADRIMHLCPGVHLIATSRQPLSIPGETLWRIPSLTLPEDGLSVEALLECESVRLFVDRAQDAKPTFEVTAENAEIVAQICHQVDGIPLALELAAARLRSLPIDRLAERLSDRFRMLSSGPRTALPRQQTLRATIDWSYDLLSEEERRLLAGMSVFAGGARLEAIEAVCEGDDMDVLDLSSALVDKSLVQMDGERYTMLETIRQYAREKLEEFGMVLQVTARHIECYLKLAEQGETAILGADPQHILDRLEEERDNLRAALREALEWNVATAARLAGSLWRFWVMRGELQEADAAVSGVLQRPETFDRTRVLTGAAVIKYFEGNYEAASKLSREALEIARAADDRWSIAIALLVLGTYEQYYNGDGAAAAACFAESEALGRNIGDRWLVGLALGEMGLQALYQGDVAKAAQRCEESVVLAREVANFWLLGVTLGNLAFVSAAQGELSRANELFKESLGIRSCLRDRVGIAVCLDGLARVAAAQTDTLRAAHLFGAAEALLEMIAGALPPAFRQRYEHSMADSRRQLHEPPFADAWDAGRKMPIPRAVEEAMQTAAPVA